MEAKNFSPRFGKLCLGIFKYEIAESRSWALLNHGEGGAACLYIPQAFIRRIFAGGIIQKRGGGESCLAGGYGIHPCLR